MGVGQGENNFSTFFNQVNCPSYRVCFYILTPTFWGLDKSKPVKLPLEPKKKNHINLEVKTNQHQSSPETSICY